MYRTWRGTWSFRRTLRCGEWQHEQFCGALELGDLVEAGAGKGGPGRGDEGAVGGGAGPGRGVAAEVGRECAVVAAFDPCVGGGLVVRAGGDEDGVGAGHPDAEPAGGAV